MTMFMTYQEILSHKPGEIYDIGLSEGRRRALWVLEKNERLDAFQIVEDFVGKPIWYQNIKGKYKSGWMLLVKLDLLAEWIRYVLVTQDGEVIKLWKGRAGIDYNFYAKEPKEDESNE